jgi:ribosome-associated translation inhibitor RaiA
MKIQLHIRGLNMGAGSRRCLEQSIEQLQSLISITAAAVVLEHRRDDTPAFRAYVSLAVPGPDVHAESRDHTLEAAWLKVISAARKRIEQRKSRQRIRATAASRNGPKLKQGLPRFYNGRFSGVFGTAH